jgi:hypothetical protein
VRFRRKSDEDEAVSAEFAEEQTEEPNPRSDGPWDSSEVTLDPEDPTKIDLGGLVLTGTPGLEVQLQVDEATAQVAGVLLAGQEGAVELRAFAAPRHGDIWDDVRAQIAAEVTRQGGTATEDSGAFGTELRVRMSVTTPDGKTVNQPSRVLGIAGPRWLLRATLFGKPAVAPDPDGEVEVALRQVVVVRGTGALAPGDPLPLVVPANARRVEPGA